MIWGARNLRGRRYWFYQWHKKQRTRVEGHLKHVHDLAGGVNVRGTCNETHGIVVDLIECVMGLWGVTTDPVKRLHEKWDRALADGGTFLEVCTSQGTIHVRNALLTYSEEKRQQILVLAIAPAAYIVPGTCRQVYHYRQQKPLSRSNSLYRSKRGTNSERYYKGGRFSSRCSMV